jgi:hypothetical protein
MKKILIPFLLFAGIAGYMSCQKEHSSDPVPVAADKTEGIKKGEPVLFSIENHSGLEAKWSVSPASNVLLTSDGNTAKILFGKAGAYLVTANTGGTSARITVNVSDSIYCDSTGHCYDSTWLCQDSTGIDTCRFGNCPPKDTIPHDTIPRDTIPRDTVYSLQGDQIHITPVKIDSGSISGLLIKASTTNSYPCTNNYLLTNVIIDGVNDSTNYIFKYPGVQVPRNCSGGQAQSRSVRSLFPVTEGTHEFKVVLNGITYKGWLTKTGNQYSFNWPYTSGVTISPKSIQ